MQPASHKPWPPFTKYRSGMTDSFQLIRSNIIIQKYRTDVYRYLAVYLYKILFQACHHKREAGNSAHTHFPCTAPLSMENSSSCVYLTSESLAIQSATSNAGSTSSVNREHASILRTTISPYPFLVRYTGAPHFIVFSISVNLFLKSETGLIWIILSLFYHI